MSKNCYISNMAVSNLYIFYKLMTYGYIDINELDLSKDKSIRYISNIRYMLDEFHIYDIEIFYNKDLKRYELKK